MKDFFQSYFQESEIKPQKLYKKWQEVLKKDLSILFPEKRKFIDINCPGCGSKKSKAAFKKLGFNYRRCSSCESLFVSPRPTAESLKNFYKNSKAVKTWEKKIMEASSNARQKYQTFPLYIWFSNLIRDYQPNAKLAVEYEPRYLSLFLHNENLSKKFNNIIFLNPLISNKKLSSSKINIIDSFNNLKNKVDVFAAFDVLDRQFNPTSFIKKVSNICKKGALFLLTTDTTSGFEYQILGKNSHRLVPPDRLNLLSTEAIHNIFTNQGFRVIDISSRGKLDVEIVANLFKNNPEIEIPKFLKYMFKHRDKDTWESLQDFLQLNNLSSCLRIAAVKK